MWMLAGCHHAVVPPAPAPTARVEAAALSRYLEGAVAAELGDHARAEKAARWLLLVDDGAWAGVHAAELLVAAGADPAAAVDRVLSLAPRLAPCEAAAALDALAAARPDDGVTQARVTEARAGLACP